MKNSVSLRKMKKQKYFCKGAQKGKKQVAKG